LDEIEVEWLMFHYTRLIVWHASRAGVLFCLKITNSPDISGMASCLVGEFCSNVTAERNIGRILKIDQLLPKF